ncbi:MAG TPA: Eco57I restriction-modification methylase domain-containing protein [Pirellulales bacterium]|nr:Eco57I restriction-modification methylase domain-containing protein [Pirellulales bacterium]
MMLQAIESESLATFAARQQRAFEDVTSAIRRKTSGHFGTPAAIAKFMADLPSRFPASTIRILDAGAGVGMLAAAVCQRVASLPGRRKLEIDAWENDEGLAPFLRRTLRQCRTVLDAKGHSVEFTIHRGDFILENAPRGRGLFDDGPAKAGYDLAVMNPPYFKLRKDSQHARAMSRVVHGQPNMYALFMAVACTMLADGGDLVAITPRSYFNGPYFRRFRRWFFERMTARHIHVFQSRTKAFQEANVLQENVILWARHGDDPRDVVVSTSEGRDLSHGVERRAVPYAAVIDRSNDDYTIRVSHNPTDETIVSVVDALPSRFRDLGLQVSTGPVVTFRATEHLLHERAEGEETAPLLMMRNVRPLATVFPEKSNGKPSHFRICDGSQPLLLPAKRYVLLKRFTAKEERRRLVAGVFESADSYAPWVAIENHLNYVYKPHSELSRDEALGLATLLNSALFDRYFRTISGSTQVNAAEIRSLPLPAWPVICEIGRRVAAAPGGELGHIQRVVAEVLLLDNDLNAYLAAY